MRQINFFPFPALRTERFTLRQLSHEDDDKIFQLRSNSDVNKYIDRPIAKSIEDARQFIHKINESIEKNEVIYWAICSKDNFELVGTICLWNISEDRTNAEIGFELLPQHQGKGIIHEVLPAIINYGFEAIKLKSIDGEADYNNLKSIKLMEKNGFKLHKKFKHTVLYSLQSPYW